MTEHQKDLHALEAFARQLRRDVVNAVYHARDGHPGPCMSIADMIAVLYGRVLRLNPEDPAWAERDRFILSKGHACPILYAALARRGFFQPAELLRLRMLDSMLQGHPDMRKTPGVEATSGSLGHGLSQGMGMALAARRLGLESHVYVMTGDGELEEGIVWEAAMSAAKHGLTNLTAIVDNNHMQSGGTVAAVGGLYPLKEKWEAFGWNVLEIDGHDVGQILQALEAAKLSDSFHANAGGASGLDGARERRTKGAGGALDSQTANQNGTGVRRGRPTAIIAHTLKGKGVPYMEGDNSWHKRVPTAEEHALAMRLLEGKDLNEA